MFGLRHCTAYKCGMNGSNTLEELDRNPIEPCPECLSKLTYATGVDKLERFEILQSFYREHGLDEEADLCRRAAGVLKAMRQTPR